MKEKPRNSEDEYYSRFSLNYPFLRKLGNNYREPKLNKYQLYQKEKREKAFQESLKLAAYDEWCRKYPFSVRYYASDEQKRKIPPPPPLPDSRKSPSVWIDGILKPLCELILICVVGVPVVIICGVLLLLIIGGSIALVASAPSSAVVGTGGAGLSTAIVIMLLVCLLDQNEKKK